MNKKILSMLIAIPVLLSGCGSKTGTPNSKDSAVLSNNVQPPSQPVIEEKLIVPEQPDQKIGEKKEVEKAPEEAAPKEAEVKKQEVQPAKVDVSKLSTSEKSWFYQPKTDGTPSGEPADILALLNKYSGYYLGDTSKKVIYLTFDEGYENGYTPKILDTLKANNVKAAFFVTSDYIKRNKDLIKRMEDEGHLVCNHSNTHPSMAQVALKGQDKFNEEFTLTEKAYEEVTGKKMPKFFRPPMGKYSELSMKYTQDLGYKSIFWSFAYKDWIPEEQPTHEAAKKVIMERTHNGAIVLLHAVSKTNTEIMDWILKEWKSKGFEFKTLNDLP
jgi:peptidoglycan-N-acetylmuramic acid deacetylase